MMNDIVRQMLIGVSSLMLAPSGVLCRPDIRITVPPENFSQAIGFDLSNVAGDLTKAIDKVEHKDQLELPLKCEPEST